MGSNPLIMYAEDIQDLIADLSSFLSYIGKDLEGEDYDRFHEIIDSKLDPFCHGYRNYNLLLTPTSNNHIILYKLKRGISFYE